MTNNEIEKLAKDIASEILRNVSGNDSLLDSIFPPRLMDIEQASEYTRIPVNTLYQKVKEIPHYKVGKRLIFSDRALIRWMNGIN